MSTPTAPPQAPARPARRRGGGTAGDMVRTTLIMGLVVVAIVYVAKDRKDDTAVKRVDSDLALTVTQVARAASFPLYAPTGLPQAWAPTSVSYGPQPSDHPVFHVGYVTPAGKYADLEESDVPVTAQLSAYTPTGRDQGSIPVAGRPTEVSVSGTSVTLTQVITSGGRTVHLGVTGSASQAELTTLLASLQPRSS